MVQAIKISILYRQLSCLYECQKLPEKVPALSLRRANQDNFTNTQQRGSSRLPFYAAL